MEYGILSIVPAVLTIIIALYTKEVLLALFCGAFAGSFIISGWHPFQAFLYYVDLLIGKFSDPWNIQVLILGLGLGSIIAMITKAGGSNAFATAVNKRTNSSKAAEGITFGICSFICFDDYFSTLTGGTVMRPVTDRLGTSREKLSYIIDSTSVGVCLLAPISSWIALCVSLCAASFPKYGITMNPFQAMMSSMAYNYYAWLSILMVAMVIFFKLDFGKMAKAEKRSHETGQTCLSTFNGSQMDDDEISSIKPSEKGHVFDLFVPMLLLICLAIFFMLYTGGFFTGDNPYDLISAVSNMDGVYSLAAAIVFVNIFSVIYYRLRGVVTITDSLKSFILGLKSMLMVSVLLVFAWCVAGICDEMETGVYLADLFSGTVPPFLVPFIVFVITCIMAFCTGASWGTIAIMMPIAIPLAVSLDANLIACLAAVLGGGGFGNHCSPIADTAILSSAAANIRHMDHIETQIPYSVTCALVGSIGFLLAGITSNRLLPMAIVLTVFVIVLFFLHKFFGENSRRISPPA